MGDAGDRKAELLAQIARRKALKGPGWKLLVMELIRELEKLEDPYGKHEFHGDGDNRPRGGIKREPRDHPHEVGDYWKL